MTSLLSMPQLDIENFINKSGTSTANTPPPQYPEYSEPKMPRKRGRPKGSIKPEIPLRVEMRIPPSILEKVDRIVFEDPLLTSRHAWLLRAIYEKVERDLDIIVF